MTGLKKLLMWKAASGGGGPRRKTVRSGNTADSAVVAHFRANCVIALESLVVALPYNASGHTSTTVHHVGVNFLQCDTWPNGVSKGVTFAGTKEGGEIVSISISGTATGDNVFRNLNYDVNVLKLPPDGSYACYTYTDDAAIVFSGNPNNIYDRNGGTYNADVTGWRIYDLEPGRGNTTEYARLQLMPYKCNGKSFDIDAYPIICLESDKGCAFEPYCGQKYAITLPETIYGGTVDLISGEIVSKYGSDGSLLPTPVTYTITPVAVSTLNGVNNVWSDYGDITLTYIVT